MQLVRYDIYVTAKSLGTQMNFGWSNATVDNETNTSVFLIFATLAWFGSV